VSTTPEGKIKKMVKELLAHVALGAREPYAFWPVPNGMGPSSLDCLICYYGVFVAVETKAPGKKPTPRQEFTIACIEKAGGVALIVDSEEGVERLRNALEMIRYTHANNCK
jgi:hypothetical protein